LLPPPPQLTCLPVARNSISALAPRCSAHSNPASPPPSQSPSNYFSYSHWPDAAASSNPRGKQRAALPPSIPSTLNQARCLPRIFVTTVTAFYPKGTPHPRRHLKTHSEPIRLPGRPRASAVPWKPFIHHPFIQVVFALFHTTFFSGRPSLQSTMAVVRPRTCSADRGRSTPPPYPASSLRASAARPVRSLQNPSLPPGRLPSVGGPHNKAQSDDVVRESSCARA